LFAEVGHGRANFNEIYIILIKQLAKIGGVDETRDMEHSGTSRNIPEYRIIIITMPKICKIKFLKIKSNKNKLVSAPKIKTNRKKEEEEEEEEKKEN